MKKTTDSGKDNCREMYVETRRQMRKQGRGRKLGPHTHTHIGERTEEMYCRREGLRHINMRRDFKIIKI